MAKRIVIVGDLPERPDRAAFLHQLAEAQPTIEWDWVQCVTPASNLPQKSFRRLLAQLRDVPKDTTIIVVKLAWVHGRDENMLYQAHPDPILAPVELATGDDLLKWLFSDEAALVKEPVWEESIRAAAMLAILAKLIKNKSWNNTKNGHMWTQEADLLRQAPVNRDGGVLYGEACALLSRMSDTVLLCKGGKQGKTKQGWCICLDQLPHIKKAILSRSLTPLREEEKWVQILEYVDLGPDERVTVDDDIVNEKVRFHCRQHR